MKKIIFPLLLLLLLGCKKPEPEVPVPGDFENGVIILNEGLFQQNNATLSFYSNETQTTSQQTFQTVNGRGLGDTANDLAVFEQNDQKYFVVAVDVSSQLEIIEANTMKSVKQIPLFDDGLARSPRAVAIASNKIYSCNFDGTVSVIQLTSLTEVGNIEVGENPDGICIQNNKLYVSNSGGLNAPNYDSTISVIDMNADTVLTEINARINCRSMIAGLNNDVYVLSSGDYAGIGPAFLRIDAVADSVVEEVALNVGAWTLNEGWIYYVDIDLNGVYRYNTLTNSFENIELIDCSSYFTPFAIHHNGSNIFMSDANNYVNSSTIRCYSPAGEFLYEFTAALNANEFIFND
jgi:hypothetical protein